jgi:hypothetical protein
MSGPGMTQLEAERWAMEHSAEPTPEIGSIRICQ